MSTGFFRGRGAKAILAAALASVVFATLLLVEDRSRGSVDTGRQDSFSYSAVGHHAFAELLGELGFTVNRTRRRIASRREVDAAWIVAEAPRDELKARQAPGLAGLIGDTSEVLLVLPKRAVGRVAEAPDSDELWLRREDPAQPGWLAAEILDDALLGDYPTVRTSSHTGPTTFTATDGTQFLVDVEDLQLLDTEGVDPLISTDEGVLVGRLREHTDTSLIVVADPDLIATHRLGHADNAAVVVWALRQLPASSRLVMIDEVIHGHAFEPSLWSELTSFPLALALVQALVAAGFLVWAGSSRFGAALPPAQLLGAGRRTLVENTAELLLRGGHATHSLRRYFGRNVETVADALHVPTDASLPTKVKLLSETSARLGRREDPAAIAQEIDRLSKDRRAGARRTTARNVLRVAHRIHRWREEMVHGPTTDPADR